MAKTKLSLMIIGSIILFMLGALITYFLLLATGQVNGEATNLNITILKNEKEYDGTVLNAEEYEQTGLLDGHSIQIEYLGGITDVGVGQSDCNVKVFDASGRECTNNYAIHVEKGTLEVTKRPITLSIKKAGTNYDPDVPVETNYDNDITDEIDYEITSDIKLCKGHRLVPDFEVGDIQNVESLDGDESYGESNINMVAAIYDINGFDVTSNYAISYKDNMKVKINKPTLTLTTISHTKEYDGEPFDEDEITYNLKGDLPKNYNIDVKYVNNINDIVNVDDSGLLVIDTRNTKITDEKGKDVTSNYKILAQNVGSLNITPVKLHLHVDDYTAEYDGLEHYYDKFEILNDEKITAINAGSGTTGFMLNGYQYNIDVDNEKYTILTNVGSKSNYLSYNITLDNSTSDENLASNFSFVYDSSPVISITRASLAIMSEELSVEYSSDFDYKSYVSTNAKLTGVLGSGEDFDSSFMISSYSPVVPTISDGGKYDVVISNIRIVKGTEIVTSNFNIYTSPITLNVKKFVINAKSNNLSATYDGNVHQSADSNFEFFDSVGNPIDETKYKIDITTKASITDVSESGKSNTFTIKVTKLNEDNGEYVDVTEDVGINYSYGIMTVYKAYITATSSDFKDTYSGDAKTADDDLFTVSGIDSTAYEIINKATITNVNESGKQNSFALKFNDSVNPTNYEISYVFGTMTLDPITINAESDDFTGTYNGTAQDADNSKFSVEGLSSDKYTIINKATITNVSESGKKNTFTVSISGSNSQNYEISYVFGTMTLDPKPITATSSDFTGTYSGIAQAAPDSYFTVDGIVSAYVISNKATITNVNESGKANTFTISGIDESNYEIEYHPGELSLAKLEIVATSGDYVGTYDGTAQVAPDSLFSVTGITSYVITGKATITNVNESGKDNTFTISGIETDNYDIVYHPGTMKLNKKTIVATSGNYMGIYDGEEHEADDASFTVTGITSYVISNKATITNVSENGKLNKFTVLVNTDNYDIEYHYGTMSLEKATLYVKWQNINSPNLVDHQITDVDCDVSSSSGTIPPYSVTTGTLAAPNTPLAVSVSYSWTIELNSEDVLNYSIVYIPGIITFDARNNN